MNDISLDDLISETLTGSAGEPLVISQGKAQDVIVTANTSSIDLSAIQDQVARVVQSSDDVLIILEDGSIIRG